MKQILNIVLAAAIALPIFWGCSLDEDTSSLTTSENFYKNAAQCLAGVNACYIPLNSLFSYTFFIAVEGCTDLAWSRSATLDAALDISPSQPRFGATAWQQGYYGVRACNGAIAGIEGSSINSETKARYLAECKIVRAFYYYYLTSFFGDVPYFTDDIADEETLERVAHLGRMSADDTRAALMKELWECAETLDQVRSCDIEDNRMGAAVAYTLIAKFALWNKQWQECLDACSRLEEIYGDLSQYPLSDIPFRYKNTPESIFEIQHTYTQGGLSYTSNVAAICMPYPKNGALYDGVEIPELGSQATAWAPCQANSYLSTNLLSVENNDPRRDLALCMGTYNGESFNHPKNGFLGPKFWCPGMVLTADGNNYKVFRYADVLLMAAEAHCMLQDDFAATLSYLNATKQRAGVRLYTRENWNAIFEEIQAERGRELFGEFQRKFDLVRWGIWYERTLEETGKPAIPGNIKPCHRYYPIPDEQVSYSGYALDNDEYHKYGL